MPLHKKHEWGDIGFTMDSTGKVGHYKDCYICGDRKQIKIFDWDARLCVIKKSV